MWHMYKYVLNHPFWMIYLSWFILKNSTNYCAYINIGYTNIFTFITFHLRGQTNWIFLYVTRLVISQDIFKKTYQNVLRDYIMTLALYTVQTCKVKQMWYQMYQADYCLKHFKLVTLWVAIAPVRLTIFRRKYDNVNMHSEIWFHSVWYQSCTLITAGYDFNDESYVKFNLEPGENLHSFRLLHCTYIFT